MPPPLLHGRHSPVFQFLATWQQHQQCPVHLCGVFIAVTTAHITHTLIPSIQCIAESVGAVLSYSTATDALLSDPRQRRHLVKNIEYTTYWITIQDIFAAV